MLFLRQIKFEIRNILKSKFLLIFGILVIVASVAIPVIGYFTRSNTNNGGIIEPTMYPVRDIAGAQGKGSSVDYTNGAKGESITVNGITIAQENPFYWNLVSLTQQKSAVDAGQYQFVHAQTQDVLLEILDDQITYYLRFAKVVNSAQDYRMDLSWRGTESLSDVYFYSHNDISADVLIEAGNYNKNQGGLDPDSFRARYVNITATQRQEGLAKASEYLSMVYAIVDNDDFGQYIDYRIKLENDQIADYQANIAIQQQAIIDNPSQEESLSQVIDNLNKQIQVIETNNIPILEYRKDKNIRPGELVWQNTAISDIENSRNQLVYMVIVTEEEYNRNNGSDGKSPIMGSIDKPGYNGGYYYYGTYTSYAEYVAAMQKQIALLNKTIIIAQKSLDANKPDMKYVPAGSRNRTVQFLDYSIFVALFGVLLGGWLIASEFQQGTIRLLMIRPKTRSKILLAKFSAALILCLFVDAAGSLLNLLTNGILFGFTDFQNPIYSVASTTGFFAFYLPRFLACMLPIIFAFTIAFMFSVLARNIAVSIAVPIILIIGSMIAMTILAFSRSITWLAYTPIPFIQLSSFFQLNSTVQMIIQNGAQLSLAYGIALLFALSVVFTLISVLVFRKRDIAN
jgi:ABC-2 type transport system permease protein